MKTENTYEDLKRQREEIQLAMDNATTIEEWLELDKQLMDVRQRIYHWEKENGTVAEDLRGN